MPTATSLVRPCNVSADLPDRRRGQATPTTCQHIKSEAEAGVLATLITLAGEGRTIFYSDLGNRGHIGHYLRRIVEEEAAAGHPPITAIVVNKATGRPGIGFVPAMTDIGFAHPGEMLEAVWHRAVAAVHDYWRDTSSTGPPRIVA